jgi:hypothetical protein
MGRRSGSTCAVAWQYFPDAPQRPRITCAGCSLPLRTPSPLSVHSTSGGTDLPASSLQRDATKSQLIPAILNILYHYQPQIRLE